MATALADTIGMATRKSTGGKPNAPRRGRAVMVYVDEPIGPAIDAFIESQRLKPSLKAIVELALQDFLEREGFWPFPPPKSK